MADGGTVIVHIEGDSTKFEKAMGGVKESAESAGKETKGVFGDVLKANLVTKGVGMVASGVRKATSSVITLGKTVVSSYSEYEQLTGGIETLFGESASTVMGYADIAYKTAGLSANDYMATATSFAASLVTSLGGDTAKAAEMADMAIIDMSDNANKMGTDMSMIQNAYQGFAKQNYSMLDNLKLGGLCFSRA